MDQLHDEEEFYSWYATKTTNVSCSELSEQQLKSLAIIKGSLAIFSCIPCLVVVLIIVLLKSYHYFVHRLALYLTSAAIFYSITTALQMIPGDLFGIHNHQFCEAVGFLSEYGSWVLLLYIYWVVIHLFLLSVFHLSTRKAEVLFVIFPVIFPLLFVWVPFIHGLYGQAGGWCWIVTANDDCTKIRAGQIEQFVLWYGPMFVASVGSIIVTLTTVVVLCRGAMGPRDESDMSQFTLQAQHKKALKEALPLLAYSVLFSLFDWVAISSRVYYAVTDNVNYPLWLVHAIGDACRGLFIPFAFLLHPYVVRKLREAVGKWRKRSADMYSTTFFVVSKEHTDETERLIVRGEDHNVTLDTGYQSVASLLDP